MKRFWLTLTLRIMARQKGRTIASFLGNLLAVTLLLAALMLFFSVQRGLVERELADTGRWKVIVSGLTQEELDAPRESFSLVGSYQELDTLSVGSYTAVIAGFDQALLDLLPVTLLEGRLPETEGEVLVPADTFFSDGQDREIGDTITLIDGQSFTVCGIMEPLSLDTCIQNDQGLKNQITLIALPQVGEFSCTGFYWTDRDLGIYQRASAAFGEKPLSYNRYALFWTTMDWDNVGKWGMLLMMGVLGLFVLTAFFTLVLNAASIALEERKRMLGALVSLGAAPGQLRGMVLFESMLLALGAIPPGIALSYGGIKLVLVLLGGNTPLLLPPWGLALGVGLILVVVPLSVWMPARRAAKIPPMEAVRGEGAYRTQGSQGLFQKIYQIFGLEGMLAAKNFRRSRGKYFPAALSIFLCVLLFIPTCYFTASYFSYLDIWYPQGREVECWYSSNTTLTPQNISLALEQFHTLSNATGVEEGTFYVETPFWVTFDPEKLNPRVARRILQPDGQYEGSVSLVFLDEDTWADYRQQVGVGEEADTRGILAQQYRNRSSSGPSHRIDYFTCNLFRSGITQTTVQGFSSAGEFSSTWKFQDFQLSFSPLVTEEYPSTAFRGLCIFFPLSQISMLFSGPDFYFLNMGSNFATDIPAETALDMELMSEQAGYINSIMDMEAGYRSLMDRTVLLRMFGLAFAGLLGLVAVVNLFSVISASLSARTRELATLSSVGLGRKRMRRMLGFECICYSFWGALPGLVAAHLCTWQVVWRLYGDVWEQGYHPPWMATLFILGLIICVVAIATWSSAGRLDRLDLIETLQESWAGPGS